MSSDDVWKKIQERPVPWDDVREQRVLNRALTARRDRRRRGTAWIFAGVVAAAVVITTVAVLNVDVRDRGLEQVAPTEDGVAAGDSDEEPSTVELNGAGRAVLSPGASVAVANEETRSVVVLQSRGLVRYEVDRAAMREVTVQAAGVEIHVIGTVFTVAIRMKQVWVEVEKGLVLIDDGQREVEIGAGEEIAVVRPSAPEGDHRDPASPVVAGGALAREGDSQLAEERAPGHDNSGGDQQGKPGVDIGGDSEVATAETESDDGKPTDDEQSGEATVHPPKTIEELLSAVDAARRQGKSAEASRLLDEIVQRFPNDPRSSTALFTMGNVERARGNHARAARAFRRCWRLYPSGPLAEDARAEAAASWASAGRRDWAAEAARRYLAIYPEGTHAKRMERLAE